MTIKELKKRIADADEDILQDIVSEWLKGHEDFCKHVEAKLCPPADDIDFGYELCRKANRETKEFYQNHQLYSPTSFVRIEHPSAIRPE